MSARRRRPLAPLLAIPLAAAALLVLAPTAPPRAPVAAGAAMPLGAAVGVVLYAVLASGRRKRSGLGVGLALALGGAGEEAIWRAFALARLAPRVGLPGAVALSTLGFAATHFPAQRARGVAVQLGTGLVFGTLFALTGSLVAAASAHGLYNLLVLAAPAPALPALAVTARGVEKRFGRVAALRGVDLTICEGEIVALLGPNGAGKTTLATILLGIRRPDRGEVRVFGSDPRSLRARLAVGATPQEMSFPPTLRVGEILAFVRAHYPDAAPADELLERFGLREVVRRQTGGISGGQRRRLAVALAFCGNPRLAVLDEPTTGLDVESRRWVWDAVRDYAAHAGTVLLTTHYLEEAEALATRIVVLAAGAVAAEGSAASLKDAGDGSLEDAYLRLTR